MLAGEETWQEEVAVKWKDPLPSFYDRFSVPVAARGQQSSQIVPLVCFSRRSM